MSVPLGLVPPVWFGNCFVGARIARDGRHDLEIVELDHLLDHLDASQVAQHVSGHTETFNVTDQKKMTCTYPTEQIAPLSTMAWDTLKASWI